MSMHESATGVRAPKEDRRNGHDRRHVARIWVADGTIKERRKAHCG